MPRISAANLAEHHDLIWSKLLSAFECILACKPLDEITLSEVAGEAGIARNTIYNYAPDKPALLTAVAELAGRSLVDQVGELTREPGTPVERLQHVLRFLVAAFTTGEHRHVLAQAVFGRLPAPDPESASAIFEKVTGDIAALVMEGVETGAFRRSIDPRVTVGIMFGSVAAGIHRIAERPEESARIGAELEAYILGALRAVPAP